MRTNPRRRASRSRRPDGRLDERQQLISSHLKLVEVVVGRLMVALPSEVEREDLVGWGLIGLINAVDRYDPAVGVKFETYATSIIRGTVLDYLRSQDWAPRTTRAKIRRIEQALARLEAQLGRPPHDTEVASALGVSVDDYHRFLSDASAVTLMSLEDVLTGSEFAVYPRARLRAADEATDPARHAQREELKRLLARAIHSLPEREREVISLYYHEGLTLREIGEVLGVTESRVCQVHTQALLRLRAWLSRELSS